jgi:hypothetical protein
MTVSDEVEREKLMADARALGIQPWQLLARRAVSDQTIRDLVNDSRRGPTQRSSLAALPDSERPDAEPWRTKAAEIPREPPPGQDLIGRMCDAQDARDRAAAIRQALDTAMVERLAQKPGDKK